MMQENFIPVDGHKIRYLESGRSKDTLILVHGLGASAERWERVIPAFAEKYRVIVPDMIGFGYSDKPPVDYTPEFFSQFLGKFLDASGIGMTSIIGSSMGGQITVEYASSHSENIKKMILVSPAGIMKSSTPALDAYIMAALYPNKQSAKNAFEMMEGSDNEVDENIVDNFIERMQMPNAKLAFMSTVLGLKNADVITEKLQSILVPTLIIWGSEDPVIPIEHADAFVSSIKGCQFYKMDGCGHTPYVQDPASFASLALSFLEEK